MFNIDPWLLIILLISLVKFIGKNTKHIDKNAKEAVHRKAVSEVALVAKMDLRKKVNLERLLSD